MTPKIKWAPKVAQAPIARLYERDAAGIHDDELLDHVGYALWARASDVALVARSGVRCPADGTEFSLGDDVWHRLPANTSGSCPTCGWQTTVATWHDSFRKTDLSGMAPFVDVYVARWPAARSYRDRMLLVDRLLHEVHATGGNLVRALIEGGKRNSPHAFLDRLAYGSASTVDHEAREVFSRTRLNYGRRARDG
jgi:hypothetical protein